MLGGGLERFWRLGGRSERREGNLCGAGKLSAAAMGMLSRILGSIVLSGVPLTLLRRDPKRRLADCAVELNSEVNPARRPYTQQVTCELHTAVSAGSTHTRVNTCFCEHAQLSSPMQAATITAAQERKGKSTTVGPGTKSEVVTK